MERVMERTSCHETSKSAIFWLHFVERSIGTGPTVIIQLSGHDMYSGNAKLHFCHCTGVLERGHFQDFRSGFRFWHICHVDRYAHFTLK